MSRLAPQAMRLGIRDVALLQVPKTSILRAPRILVLLHPSSQSWRVPNVSRPFSTKTCLAAIYSPSTESKQASEASQRTPTIPSTSKTYTKPISTPVSTPSKPASQTKPPPSISDMTQGLSDELLDLSSNSASSDTSQVDWTRSFHGLSAQPFSKEAADVLMAEIPMDDVEVKPDGIIYLPEIKYRRILNRAFGPGGWGLAPRGETIVTGKSITREYALVAHGRLVSVARGEQDYFSPEGIPTATEGCKSNALMRCCKDLGVASELWDPRYIRGYMKEKAKQIWVEHVPTKKKKQIWIRKDDEVRWPYTLSKYGT